MLAATLVALTNAPAAVLGAKELIGELARVTAAFSSSLLTSVAIAQRMRQEREARIRGQAQVPRSGIS